MEEEKKKLDYSRLKLLISKIGEFIDTLPEEVSEDDGITILLLANDIKNNTTAKYTFLNEEDERQSLVDLLDECLSSALKGKDKHEREWEIFNSIGEYMVKLCAMFPELYDNFCIEVENERNKLNKEE